MIKVIEANYQGNFEIALAFSDSSKGIFDGASCKSHNSKFRSRHGRPLGAIFCCWRRCFRRAISLKAYLS